MYFYFQLCLIFLTSLFTHHIKSHGNLVKRLYHVDGQDLASGERDWNSLFTTSLQPPDVGEGRLR